MALWTFAELVDDLQAAVAARPGITGLTPLPQVRVSIPAADEPWADLIVLGVDASDTKEPVAIGTDRHDEEVSVTCYTQAIRYGSGETEAKAARDRANLLLSEVDDEIRTNPPTVGDQQLRMKVTERDYKALPWEDSNGATLRLAQISFTIDYRARTS